MRSAVFSAVAMATTVSAHAQVYGVWVNGQDQGDGRGVYIRSPDNNSPVKDLASPDIVCNVNGGKPVPDFVSVAAGDSLAFEWYHDTRNDDIIDQSHQGPIITWIAEYTEGDGTGPIWSKIDEEGYDGSEWAVAKLIANGGKKELTVPEGLAPGRYLVRQEIIAHHESDTAFSENEARGAQFYPSCAQIEVTGSGSAVPDQGFDFNTDYTYEDPGIVFNLYGDFTSYEIPGPEVWDAASSGGDSASPVESGASSSDAAAPTATTPAEEAEEGTDESSPVESDAPSSTQDADPVSSSPADSSVSPTPIVDEPVTEVTEIPSEEGSESANSPKPTPTKAPATGCRAKRRRSMKKRISSVN